jgi:hypothetical protein
MKYITPS